MKDFLEALLSPYSILAVVYIVALLAYVGWVGGALI